MYVFCRDVGPTAPVTNSGPTPEGSPVTFTVANLANLATGETPTLWTDWAGSGTFQQLNSSDVTTNPDGSLSFTHVYDDSGTYPASILVMVATGASTDYA